MKISIIVAYGKNGEIGLGNDMLWHIPNDFKNFKEITSGHHILMGRNTFESIGKPLPNRTSLILTKSEFNYPGTISFDNVDSALEYAKNNGEEELFVIGGGKVYEELLPYATKLYLSKVNWRGDADTFFNIEGLNSWELERVDVHKEIVLEDRTIPAWDFCIYEKKTK